MAQEVKIDIKFKLLSDINKRVADIGKSIKDLNKTNVTSITSSFEKLAIFTTGLNQALELSKKAFSVAQRAIGGFVKEAGKIEDLATQFETLTGSAENAQKLLSDLQQFAARTPFKIEGLAQASRQLLSFGFAQNEVINRLQVLGDVAAASGSDIKELSLIFGQVRAAGKLTGERLLQFQERAVPIGSAIAKTLGVAEESIRDLVSQGKVTFDVFDEAFKTLTQEGGQFANGMVRQSKTLSGVLSTLSDNFALLQANIGKELLPIVKQAVNSLITYIQVNQKLIKLKVIEFFKSLVSSIGSVLRNISRATPFFFAISNSIELLTNFALRAARGLLQLAESATKLIDFIPGVDTAVEGLGDSIKNIEAAIEISEKKLQDSADSFNSFEQGANKAAETVENFSKKIGEIPAIKKVKVQVTTQVQEATTSIVDRIKSTLKEVGIIIKDAFSVKNIAGTIKGLSDAFSKGAKGFLTFVAKGIGKAVGGPLGKAIGEAAETFINLFGKAPEKFREQIINIFKELPILIANILVNVLSFAEIISEGLVVFIDKIPMIVETFVETFITKITDPVFIAKLTLAVATALIRAVPRAVGAFIVGIKNGLSNVFGSLGSVFSGLISALSAVGNIFLSAGDIFAGAVNFFKDIIDGFKKVATGGAVGGFVGDIIGGVTDVVGSIGGAFGFAEGGDVPNLARYQNDRFPAKLSSGEAVLSQTTSERINDFLDRQEMSAREQTVVVNLQVGEQELANVLLNLNEKGFRVA